MLTAPGQPGQPGNRQNLEASISANDKGLKGMVLDQNVQNGVNNVMGRIDVIVKPGVQRL